MINKKKDGYKLYSLPEVHKQVYVDDDATNWKQWDQRAHETYERQIIWDCIELQKFINFTEILNVHVP